MKKIARILGLVIFSVILFENCGSSKKTLNISPEESQIFKSRHADTVEISDPESNYDIIIIEPGFDYWLRTIARPRGYYSQSYFENRNRILVIEWNNRVMWPMRYDPLLYEFQINYNPNIDYGYEVNYKLYNYFIYFQRKYGQRLGPFIPRI